MDITPVELEIRKHRALFNLSELQPKAQGKNPDPELVRHSSP